MKKKLSDLQWTTCWMAVRYACGRQSIASNMLAGEVVQEYYPIMTELQRSMLSRDVRSILKDYPNYNKCDQKTWAKFCKCMDTSSHRTVKLKDKSKHTVFDIKDITGDDRLYPLAEYIKNPFVECYVDPKDVV